jgi:alkylation response protein AidB-like acyl-CoA dehydrogenase
MHPAVLSYWLAAPDEAFASPEFQTQLAGIVAGVKAGDWWGTITSEPGSGGDVAKTRATATPTGKPHGYWLSGDKHFGSGSGMLRYMVTTAVAESDEAPDWFFVDMQNVPCDGSCGVKLIAEWDGQGMTATQSHAMKFERFPATRIAWAGHLTDIAARSGPLIGCMFTAVIVGVVDAAMQHAHEKIRPADLRAYEQIEWERAQLEAWLIEQAFAGMLRAVETASDARREVLQGKTAIAELAEQILTRLARILGGGTFHRRSPIGHWAQDVKALGFLRPPWGLAWETLIAGSAAT